MNSRSFAAITALLALVLGAPAVSQQQASEPGAKPQEKIDQLLALPAKERRAQLKEMAPEERRGLWMQLKRHQFAARGTNPPPSGAYQSGGNQLSSPVSSSMVKVIGTIAYDSGFPSIAFGGGQLVGNRFNTHTGIPVVASGTVSTIAAVVVPGPANTTPSAGYVLYGPQTTMGGALAISSGFDSVTGVIDTVSFTGLGANYTGSEFFVLFGDFAQSYVPVLGTGTTLGQGHHGLVGYTGGIGLNITGTFNLGGNVNTFVRPTGNIVPVELMQYEVD